MNSKLQIISGRFRGRKLFLPSGARPTQNRARAALFNMIASNLFDYDDNFVVWDAFAGSGAFGIEILSRYPEAKVVFTDSSPESIQTVRKNLSLIDAGPAAVTDMVDANMAVKKYGSNADLIFVDAPYDNAEAGASFVRSLTKRAKTGAVLIWEQEKTQSVQPPCGWDILRDKTYGRARFLIMCRKSE